MHSQLSQIMTECSPNMVAQGLSPDGRDPGISRGLVSYVVIENFPDQCAPYRGKSCVTTPPNATREQVIKACFDRGHNVVDITIPEASRQLSSSEPDGVLSQRDMMRYLVSAYGRNEDIVCRKSAQPSVTARSNIGVISGISLRLSHMRCGVTACGKAGSEWLGMVLALDSPLHLEESQRTHDAE